MIDKYLIKLEYNVIINELVNYCYTFIGKKMASSLMPFTDKNTIENSLKETTDARLLNNSFGSFPISDIDDLSIPLKRIESGISLSAKSLLDIAILLKVSRELQKYFNNACLSISNLQESTCPTLLSCFSELYSNEDIERKIFKSILSEDTIADEASPKLASIRRNRKNIELEIRNKLNNLIHSNTYSKYIMDSVITIRNERFVIPVKEEYKANINGFIHDTSSSGSTVYIEPMAVFEMNNSISNLLIEENKEIERILNELSGSLYPISGNIFNTVSLIGKLDFINAKAKLSIVEDASSPIISSYINFINARHPLINKDKVVPINIYVGKDFSKVYNNSSSNNKFSNTISNNNNRSTNNYYEISAEMNDSFGNNSNNNNFSTLVITGPNTGGKTVTLKTVGLLCAMAQSGLNIPVDEGSKIKIFDNIFADIGDEQSIEESLSTFSSHITNIVNILSNFTKDSLILVDELGSGTDPIEGANLAISLLEYFNKSGATTIATTHYHEIKEYCITHSNFENASCEFDLKTLKPTYHLLIGIPGKSNAFAISQKLGIPQSIIDRASSLISKPDVDIEGLMKEIYDDKLEIENEKIEIQKNLNQIEILRKSLEHESSDKLAHEKENIEKAKSEARQILIDAKEEADSIIKDLNKMDKINIKKANNLRNKLNTSIQKSGGNQLDFSGLINLNSNYNHANKTTFKNTNKSNNINSNKNISKSSSVHINNNHVINSSTEINLIGENVANAIEILDKYLDSCTMAHLHQIRIVHGKGTGKLRQGIHQYLQKSRYVESFNIAGYGEGDYGVTIVNLKK